MDSIGVIGKVPKKENFLAHIIKVSPLTLFLRFQIKIVMDLSWWPFWVVIVLFVLAIVSPWAFPNSKVSKNKHDNKF
jgi:hypothetical protein